MSNNLNTGTAVAEIKPGFNERIVALAKMKEADPVAYSQDRRDISKEFGVGFPLIDKAVDMEEEKLTPPADTEGDAPASPDKMSPARKMVMFALQHGMTFWRDSDANAYATVPFLDGHIERHKVRSSRFKLLLRSIYGTRQLMAVGDGTVLPGSIKDAALDESISTLEAKALSGEIRTPRVRVVDWQGAIWIDLCDDTWQLIRVTRDGWQIISGADVPLVRANGMLPLPTPVNDPAAFDTLVDLINVTDDADRKMVVMWMVAALWPTGPFPILAFDGEHGSAKTSICKIARNLVDPNVAGLTRMPKKEEDLLLSASNARVLGFENLSFVSPEMSDALCSVSTGAGFRARKLYTDGEEHILRFCNPIIMNGINSMLAREDLADRAISVTLPRIDDAARMTEKEVESRFSAVAPCIFGWLLDGMVMACKNLPTLKLEHMPRMADFAKLACAAAPAFGWTSTDILAALDGKRMALGRAAVDANLVGKVIEDLAIRCGTKGWEGNATKLLGVLNQHAGVATLDKAWPKDATRMSTKLREIAPALRLVGVIVEAPDGPEKVDGKAARIIRISLTPQPTVAQIEFQSTPENTEMMVGNSEPEFDPDFWAPENGFKTLPAYALSSAHQV
jgi:hypothetical protein